MESNIGLVQDMDGESISGMAAALAGLLGLSAELSWHAKLAFPNDGI